jgi:anaerobic C4-dicarboxylate transporter
MRLWLELALLLACILVGVRSGSRSGCPRTFSSARSPQPAARSTSPPTAPLAAGSFDQTGTTRIGKVLLNHSFMLPGLVATASATAIAMGLARWLLS